jgi:two-component system sensor histidine kinase KdpD
LEKSQVIDPEAFEAYCGSTEEARHAAAGTGLGLSIAKKAAEAHGGRTWVVSEEQTGTTFFLALPRGLRRQA